MNYEILKKYLAKTTGETVYHHSTNLVDILDQLHIIHDIDNLDSIKKSAMLHDIGKCVKEFQENMESKFRKVRHELLSASYVNLTVEERLIILLHHKDVEYWKNMIGNIPYKEQLIEIENNLKYKFENINDLLKTINKIRQAKEMLGRLDLILMLGYLKMADHTASAGIKNIVSSLYAKEIYNFPSYKSIQEQVLNMEKAEDIVLVAPTGTGKTETSLLWSDKVQNKDNTKKIFYLLPYTASINALYKRLKKEGISVGVLHSKVKSLIAREEDIINDLEELELFKKNVKQVTVCTIFQVLKAIFRAKNWEMQLAQFKDSIFIVDEIHCFNIRELAFLLESLRWLKKNLNIQICVMSASIPTNLLEVIKDRLEISKMIYAEEKDFKERHRVHYKDKTIFQIIKNIKLNIDKNKKVLLCVNKVDTAQELYSMFKKDYPNKKIKLIHGRFNARDRAILEQGIDNCDILIGTQAIEVSLDIDYDIMFTEIAPLDSLLQRFGRVNRKGVKGISDIIILKEAGFSIYDSKIIENTLEVLKEIDGGIVQESRVTELLNRVYTGFNKEEYNKHKGSIDIITNGMVAGTYNKNATEEMILTKDTQMTVLPRILVNEYRQYIENKKYIEASELFVTTNIKDRSYIDVESIKGINICSWEYDDRGLIKE